MKKIPEKILNIDKSSSYGNIPSNILKMLALLFIAATISEVMYSFNLGNQNMSMLYLLAVVIISSITPTYVYGILAALLGTFAYDFQITAPRMGFSFTLGLPITLLIMLLVTVVVSMTTARIKERAYLAFRKEQRAQQLYGINRKLLAARDLDTITGLTKEYVEGYLGRPAILYLRDPSESDSGYRESAEKTDGQMAPLYTPEQIKRVHRIFRIGESETGRPFDDSSYDVYNVPVSSKGHVLGVIGIVCNGNPVGPNDLIFVQMLAGQVALALELRYLSDEQSHIAVEAEKEKIRSTLMRSISNDLREPLTDILEAISAILAQKNLDAATLESLANGIKIDTQWLIRMVENISIITRISGGSLNIKKEPDAAEKVVSEAVSIIRKRFPGYSFHAHLPEEPLLVPMDGALISQVLINLLENAVKNSPDGSLILADLRKKDGYAEFDIMDNGSGIPESMLDSLFELNSILKGKDTDAMRGTGWELSICKTIVQAHGGTIEGQNRSKQGAKFSFRLPLQETAKNDE